MRISSKKQKLINEVKVYLDNYFTDKNYFACIYGSFANGMDNRNSDIDMIVATENYKKKDLILLKEFILSLHTRNNLKTDNEVPYENKLMISYMDFEKAARLRGFKFLDKEIVVPKIVKTKKNLGSKQIKFRLALNSLTSPHIFIGNDQKRYIELKDRAERNLVLFGIYKQKKNIFERKLILDTMMLGGNGENGELYLGYKNYLSVISYLKKIIDKNLDQLEYEGYLILNRSKIEFKNHDDIISLI